MWPATNREWIMEKRSPDATFRKCSGKEIRALQSNGDRVSQRGGETEGTDIDCIPEESKQKKNMRSKQTELHGV